MIVGIHENHAQTLQFAHICNIFPQNTKQPWNSNLQIWAFTCEYKLLGINSAYASSYILYIAKHRISKRRHIKCQYYRIWQCSVMGRNSDVNWNCTDGRYDKPPLQGALSNTRKIGNASYWDINWPHRPSHTQKRECCTVAVTIFESLFGDITLGVNRISPSSGCS